MPVDFDERAVTRAIRRAAVVSVFFPWFGKALVIDTRYDAATPPAVFVDDMAGSVAERGRALAEVRPTLGRVTRLTAVPWPAGVESFVASGQYERVVDRLRRLGFPDMERDCSVALRDLRAAERAAMTALVRGHLCRTIYRR